MNNYFPHDSNARNDSKILRLRIKHKAAGYGVYFMILERLREETDYVSVKDYDMIAFDLRVDAALVKSVVEDFGLFAFTEDGECFYSESFNRRMSVKDTVSQQRSNAAAAKWGKAGDDTTKKRSERLAAARKKGTHTEEEWNEMKKFFGECVICGSKENIVKDHIVPLYQGGSDGITNLQPLCRSCSSRKGADYHDYRIDYCERNACKMPAKWDENACKTPAKWVENACKTPAKWDENACKMPAKWVENACKESKVKESKVKENLSHTPNAGACAREGDEETALLRIFADGTQPQEAITMRFKVVPSEIPRYVADFCAEQRAKGVAHNGERDLQIHFTDWLRYQVQDKRQDNGTNHDGAGRFETYAERNARIVAERNARIDEYEAELDRRDAESLRRGHGG